MLMLCYARPDSLVLAKLFFFLKQTTLCTWYRVIYREKNADILKAYEE